MSFCLHKLGVGAALDYPSVAYYKDKVGVADGGKAVGDNKGGSSLGYLLYGGLYLSSNYDVEYEYLVVNGEFDIDKA